jgi:hypothetical protein
MCDLEAVRAGVNPMLAIVLAIWPWFAERQTHLTVAHKRP